MVVFGSSGAKCNTRCLLFLESHDIGNKCRVHVFESRLYEGRSKATKIRVE
jgi:hypothetical protein